MAEDLFNEEDYIDDYDETTGFDSLEEEEETEF